MGKDNKRALRQKKLLEFIKKQQFATTKELMDIADCSYPTLCRDLLEFENQNRIEHHHGSIRYLENDISQYPTTVASSDYYLYKTRMQLNAAEKIAIGKAAAQLIQPNDIIFISHGTTTTELAKSIDRNQVLTVITDGLDIINALTDHPNIRLYTTGGNMNYSSMQIEHNPYLSCDISNININKIIIGIGGISLSHGLTFYDFNSFSFIEQIINNTSEIIVLTDSTKFEYVALANFISIDKVTTLVTDWDADPEFLMQLRQRGVQCITASRE